MNNYIEGFKKKSPQITELGLKDYKGSREEVIYLIKVLWGVSIIKGERKEKDMALMGIKNETTNGELSKFLNKLIISVNTWYLKFIHYFIFYFEMLSSVRKRKEKHTIDKEIQDEMKEIKSLLS